MVPELFRDTEYNVRFDAWTGRIKATQGAYAWRMYDQIVDSVIMGQFIWDNELSDLARFFSRDYFADNWPAIIDALQIAGTFECYLIIIQSALGAGTLVDFVSPAPSHLQINITTPTGVGQWVAYHNDQNNDIIAAPDANPDTAIVFADSIAQLTVNETVKLIELLNVNGVFVEVNFV